MERQYQHGGGRNERQGRERMQGLGGEWYGRDAQGQVRHQRWAGDQDREYSGSGDLWDEDAGDHRAHGRDPAAWYGNEDRNQSWAGRNEQRGQGRDDFSRSQRYPSGGDRSSSRAGSRYGGESYRTGGSGGWRGDYESMQRSQPYRYGSQYGDSDNRGQSHRGHGPKNYTRSDDRIREDLNERLMDADDIDASDVSVEVKDGVVMLSGSVEQRWLKHRIEDMADDCIGVKDIRNEIRVQSRDDWPYDKPQVSGGMGGTASSQGASANSSGVSSSSRSQTGSSAH